MGICRDGPNNLALTIQEIELRKMGLSDARGNCLSTQAWSLHQSFTYEVIARVAESEGLLASEKVQAWIRARIALDGGGILATKMRLRNKEVMRRK